MKLKTMEEEVQKLRKAAREEAQRRKKKKIPCTIM